MNFSLTEDQVLIRDSAETLLADASTPAAVRAAMDSAAGFDESLWQRIAGELGWCGTAIAEESGGLGLGPVELVLIQEQAGRRLLCAPFFSTVCLGANLLAECGTAAARAEYLPAIAAGRLIASAPLGSELAGWQAPLLSATRLGETWLLAGGPLRVPDGMAAELLLLNARCDDGSTALFAVPRGTRGLTVTPLQTWDASRRFAAVELQAVQLGAEARVDDPERVEGLARAAALARLYLAAEQLGCAQQCLDLTVAYVSTRKQFGRAIASFQAVKHRCAEMMVRVESLRSAVYGAAAFAAGAGPVAAMARECAMARMLAIDTCFFCAQEAIQLHGGVGFTWDYEPQLYFKHAQASSHWLGNADALREQIGMSLVA
ncbi:MAG TPA: acyl-CoA dehydrogenase family protein [Solimonas sp.]|nr:acyl-CoA dehydrogenase family protein [Solimonas sp.]